MRHGKPDPEVFLVAAGRLGVTPGRAIVVEDAAHGIEAAHRAGMRVVSVGALAGGDLVVRSLDQLGDDAFERLLDAR